MAQTVEGFIGNESVSLKNAATEVTLTQLLAVAKSDNQLLKEMARKAGVDAKAIEKAQKAMEQQMKQGEAAGSGLSALAPKASLLGGFMMDMGASAVKTMGNLVDFGDELMEGKARASDLFKAFKDLPLGLGLVATIFQKVMQYQERNLDVYRQISDTGAGLNGSLNSLRTTASGMYLSLEEFAEVTKANSDIFRQLGGNAGAGAKAFQDINKTMMQGHLGDELLNLGYGFKEANNLLGSYIRTSGDGIRSGKNVAQEYERLAKATAAYGKDLDFLARLTGESRDAAQKKFEEAQMETSWQMFVNSITDPVRKANIEKALITAQATGDKGVIDLFKARMMGFGGAFSEEGMTIQSTFRGMSNMVEGLVQVGNSRMSQEKAELQLDRLLAKGQAATIQEIKNFKDIIMSTGQGADGVNATIMNMQKQVNQLTQAGKTNEAQILQSIINTRTRQNADEGAAAAATQNEKRMKELGNQINQALLPVMELLADVGGKVVKQFSDFVSRVDMKSLGESLAKFLETVMDYTSNLLSSEGRDKIINDLKYLFQMMIIEVKRAVIPWYLSADSDLAALKGDKEIVDARAQKAKDLQERQAQLDMLRLAADEKEREKYEQTIVSEKKKLEKLKAEKDQTEEQKKVIKELEKSVSGQVRILEGAKGLSKSEEAQIALKEKLSKQDATAKTASKMTSKEKDQAIEDRANELLAEMMNDPALMMNTGGDISGLIGSARAQAEMEFKGRRGGSIGATGKLIENFGKGTNMTLHGNEAVVTEDQLVNLAKGTAETGAAQAQNALANAINALNKQQEKANQLLGNIADYTRRTSESGNKFARV